MNFTNGGVIGADVSFYQDDNGTPQQINFFKMVDRGASFVIVRAGQNLWPDPDWMYNWRNAKVTGLSRGAYFFYDSRVPPEQQATLFAEQVIGDLPELELWIDLEENYGGPYAGYVHWKKFLNRLRSLLPAERIGIYTSYGYIAGKIPQSEYYFFASFVLWLAWYTFDSEDNPYPIPEQVTIPKPWTECLYWQWGTPAWGFEWGCESREIDQNIFNGTATDFAERYQQGVPMPEHYYLVRPSVAGETRSIRKSEYPNINGMKIGQINVNNSGKCRTDDVVNYSTNVSEDGIPKAQVGDRWLHIFEANGAPIDGWIAEIHLGRRYLTVEEVGEVIPPTVVYPSSVTLNYPDGTHKEYVPQ